MGVDFGADFSDCADRHIIDDMRRLPKSLLFAILASSAAATAQVVQPVATQVSASSISPKISIEALSDTRGIRLNSYLGNLSQELHEAIPSHQSDADSHSGPAEPSDFLLAIDAQGTLKELRLESEKSAAPMSRAAWTALKDVKYSPLPTGLNDVGLKLRVHIEAY